MAKKEVFDRIKDRIDSFEDKPDEEAFDTKKCIHDHFRVFSYFIIFVILAFALFSNGIYKINFSGLTGSTVIDTGSAETGWQGMINSVIYIAALVILIEAVYFIDKAKLRHISDKPANAGASLDRGVAEYIVKARELGFNDDVIKTRLAKVGWDKNMLDSFFVGK